MAAAAHFIIPFLVIGVIAGFFLSVFGLLTIVVLPSLIVLTAIGLMGLSGVAWYVYPTAWIAQQGGYLLAVAIGRPGAYRAIKRQVIYAVRHLAL